MHQLSFALSPCTGDCGFVCLLVNKTLVHKLHEFLILPCKLMSLYDF